MARISMGRRVVVVVVAALALGAPLGGRAEAASRSPRAGARLAATVEQRDSVRRLYKAYFLREPDAAGWTHWADEYASGRMSLEAISQFFSQSSEFRNRYGTLDDAAFVRLVYQNVLGRAPDSAGVAYWVGVLRSGSTRGRVMLGFSESSEFVRKTGTTPPLVDWVRQFVSVYNAKRSSLGKPAVSVCGPNMSVAGAHSIDVAKREVLDPNSADGKTPAERLSAAGSTATRFGMGVVWVREPYALDAKWLVDYLVVQPNYTEAMGDASLTQIGVGRTRAASGLVYWVILVTDRC